MTYQRFYHNGFTLLELLVTVAILTILATISIAQFEKYRQKAYDAQAINAFHNLRDAFLDFRMNEPEGKNFYLDLSGVSVDNFSSIPAKVKAKLGNNIGSVSFAVQLDVGTYDISHLSVGHCLGSGAYSMNASDVNKNYTYMKYPCEEGGKGPCAVNGSYIGVYFRPECF